MAVAEALVSLNVRIDQLQKQLDLTHTKWNVRIENNAFTGEPKAETDSQLLEKVKEECKKVGIDLLDNDIARCHRSSAPSRRDGGPLSAQTIIKLNRQYANGSRWRTDMLIKTRSDSAAQTTLPKCAMRLLFTQDDSSMRQWSRNLRRRSAIPGKSAS